MQTPLYRFNIENTSYISFRLNDWIRESNFNTSSFTDISANIIDYYLDDLPPDLVYSSDEEEEGENTNIEIMWFLSLYD